MFFRTHEPPGMGRRDNKTSKDKNSNRFKVYKIMSKEIEFLDKELSMVYRIDENITLTKEAFARGLRKYHQSRVNAISDEDLINAKKQHSQEFRDMTVQREYGFKDGANWFKNKLLKLYTNDKL